MATAGQDKMIKLNEIRGSMVEVLSLQSKSFVNDFCFEDSGKLLFTGCQDSKIHIWNLRKRRMVSTFGSHSEPVGLPGANGRSTASST